MSDLSLDSALVSPHFARWEFTLSNTAVRRGIPNVPSVDQWANIEALAKEILEPARAALGPLHINSGFRCPALNFLIGGARTSQHMEGEASDLIPYAVSKAAVLKWIYTNSPYDQLIWEFGGAWIHVSHKRGGPQRAQPLIAVKKGDQTIYTPMSEEQIATL